MIFLLGFDLKREAGVRYELDLAGVRGSVASVMVNEVEVGVIPFPPFRGEITGALRDGNNVVKITVYGSLRNVFGPLHNVRGDELPLVTKEAFSDESAWTDDYRLAPYGMLEPPRLIRIRPESAEPQPKQPSPEPPSEK
jgi:hypothetical protein